MGECGRSQRVTQFREGHQGALVLSWDLGVQLESGCPAGICVFSWDLGVQLESQCSAGISVFSCDLGALLKCERSAGIWVFSWDLSVQQGSGCSAGAQLQTQSLIFAIPHWWRTWVQQRMRGTQGCGVGSVLLERS